jgi:hypothetical protein
VGNSEFRIPNSEFRISPDLASSVATLIQGSMGGEIQPE